MKGRFEAWARACGINTHPAVARSRQSRTSPSCAGKAYALSTEPSPRWTRSCTARVTGSRSHFSTRTSSLRDLALIGYVQPWGSIMAAAEAQAKLAADYLRGAYALPAKA